MGIVICGKCGLHIEAAKMAAAHFLCKCFQVKVVKQNNLANLEWPYLNLTRVKTWHTAWYSNARQLALLHAKLDHLLQLLATIGFHIENQLGEAGLT